MTNKYQAGGQPMVMQLDRCEQGWSNISKYGNYAKGIRQGETLKVKRCGREQMFEYPKHHARPLEGHAESKIIEDWCSKGAPDTTLT